MIHSDQGYHFTHTSYQNNLKENGVTQSMSRKGTCLDNSPIESFFGHLKDLIELN
jgi:transposase InsO family protein